MTKTKDLPEEPEVDRSLPEGTVLPEQRPAGPLDDEIPPPDNVELLAMIISAAKVEVVFSDGEAEIAGLTALTVTAAKFNPTAAGLKLTAGTIEVVGPAGRPVAIAGYALFIDGIQAAYAPRAEPLQLHENGRFNLTDDIVFPG